jgi:Tfp pilus assembly protein PilF
MRHLIIGLLLLLAFCSYGISGPERIVAGRVALRRGDIDQAVAQLEKAVAINPNNYEGHYYLGLAYACQAQKKGVVAGIALTTKAKDELARAAALNPNFSGARLELIKLSGKAPTEAGARQSKGVGEVVKRVLVRTLENIAWRAAFSTSPH